jgi:hypothetical protein
VSLPDVNKDELNIDFKEKMVTIATFDYYLEYSYPYEIFQD